MLRFNLLNFNLTSYELAISLLLKSAYD
jgi:hypothetical protein